MFFGLIIGVQSVISPYIYIYIKFGLSPVLFKNESHFILIRDYHITHYLNKSWGLKLIITCHCIFKTKEYVKLKKY